ncbi:MAG TPA: hypothetical protein PK513_04940 [Alphaproteobacteria bacterium]|nr:hypothetical protein [Alphaproteobacteria bacterium]USO06036.1 MAG: hypothetical protein H6859_02185 [Rhodospirillales bacterium]HOO81826.1 hypothetical protein [Alphaproteobacteria bacterium]
MYDIPNDFNELLSGCRGEINLVGFGPYDIQIHCGNYTIQTYAHLKYVTKEKTFTGNAEEQQSREVLLKCIGQDIKDIQKINENSFVVSISNGDKITFIADKPEFECIMVRMPDNMDIII